MKSIFKSLVDSIKAEMKSEPHFGEAFEPTPPDLFIIMMNILIDQSRDIQKEINKLCSMDIGFKIEVLDSNAWDAKERKIIKFSFDEIKAVEYSKGTIAVPERTLYNFNSYSVDYPKEIIRTIHNYLSDMKKQLERESGTYHFIRGDDDFASCSANVLSKIIFNSNVPQISEEFFSLLGFLKDRPEEKYKGLSSFFFKYEPTLISIREVLKESEEFIGGVPDKIAENISDLLRTMYNEMKEYSEAVEEQQEELEKELKKKTEESLLERLKLEEEYLSLYK